MALGSVRSSGSDGENICHITGLRMRVTGSGNLDMQLRSMDDIYTQTLVPFTLAAATNIQPFRLANFTQQRAYLRVSMDEIDEKFRINRIIIFMKPIFTMHPA